MKKRFHPAKYYLVGLFLAFALVIQAEKYSPKCLNAVPKYLVNAIKTRYPNATLKLLEAPDSSTDLLELAYPDYDATFWYYFTLIAPNTYEVEKVNTSTGEREKFTRVITKNGDEKYLSQKTLEEIQDLNIPALDNNSSQQSSTGIIQKYNQTEPLSQHAAYESQSNNHWQQQPNQHTNTDIENPLDTEATAPSTSWFSSPLLVGYTVTTACFIWGYYLLERAKEGARYLYRDDLWSAWKASETYDVLLMIKPEGLSYNLIEAIRIKYYGEENPVACFLHDIEEEYDMLLQWIQFRGTIQLLYLPIDPNFYTLEDRVEYLELLRKAINYWKSKQLSKQLTG